MAIYNNWKNGTQYSFMTESQGILPLSYSHVTMEGSASYDLAKMAAGENIYAQWRKIYPSLTGIVDDPAQYEWLAFRTSSGQLVWLASCWIQGTSVTPVQFRQQMFVLTDTSDAQIAQVKNFMDAIRASYTTRPID